ncbi:MAG: tetratricopeptide repeat protein [Polyangiaceae bacterium]|nr:tetratricopeptide repeat protein [Polyangiaceae bacterium]MCW5791351.1 tetratricopeptide repeat protein [Polyangiaceae bacterium]
MADESGDPQHPSTTRSDSRAPARRPSLIPSALDGALEAPLQDEEHLLESLVSALARGEPLTDRWAALSGAAARDGRRAELAAAYERVTSSARVRVMAPALRAEIQLHAARFWEDAGDLAAALRSAERALELAPDSGPAFQLARELALQAEDAPRLAQLYLGRLPQQSEAERVTSLRQARLLLSQLEATEEASLPLLEELSQLEPHDTEILATLAARHLAAGRPKRAAEAMERELVALPEHQGDEPADPAAQARRAELHRALSQLYLGSLGAREPALTHLTALLEIDPSDADARSASSDLLEQRSLAGRAAQALARAYQRTDQLSDAASMLTLELGLATGTRRGEAARELALLKQDHLDDPAGARELLEPLVSRDPADDDLRERYVALCAMVDKRLDAARLLARSSTAVRDPDAKARVLSQVGRLFLQSGEERRALTALQSVLETGSKEPCVLRAAYELTEIYSRAGDARRVAQALASVVELEAEPARRHPAAERLARLAEELREPRLTLTALSALVDSPSGDRALEQLAQAYSEQRDEAGLAWVLERRAERAPAMDARELIQQAARLQAERLGDRREAIRLWGLAATRYGVGAPAHQELCRLHEAERDHESLAPALRALASALPEAERPEVLIKAGRVASERLGDATWALACFEEALAIEPGSEPVQTALWRLTTSPDTPEVAAAVSALMRAASQLGDAALEARVLRWRAEHEAEPARALEAYQALLRHVDAGELDAAASLSVILGGLRGALVVEPDSARAWVERLRRLSGEDGGASAAELIAGLGELLGEGPLETAPQLWVAELLAEVLGAAGETQAAVEVLRRAHAFAPQHPGLVEQIEMLLAQGGTPEERLTFYREALSRGAPGEATGERRAQLLHGLARLHRRELGDPAAARDAWRELLELDPLDVAAHTLLVEVHRELGELREAEEELLRALPLLAGSQRLKAQLGLAAVYDALEQPTEALGYYLMALRGGALTEVDLTRAEQLATGLDDVTALGQLLEHRLAAEQDARRRAEVELRYAVLLEERLEQPEPARAHWLAAAELAEHELDDPALGVQALSRALALGPAEAALGRRLARQLATLGRFSELAPVIERIGQDSGLSAALTALAELEPLVAAVEPGAESVAARQALAQIAEALGARAAEDPAEHDARASWRPADTEELLALRIRALAPLQEASATVIQAYQELAALRPSAELFQQIEAYLRGLAEPRSAAFRWLFEARAARAEEPLPIWLEWAQVEEQLLAAPEAAERLLSQVLEQDPEHDLARCELSRLMLIRGDAEGASALLEARRAEVTGELRVSMDLQLARLWLSADPPRERSADHPEEDSASRGLPLLSEVLAREPGHAEALELALAALGRPALAVQVAEVLDRALAAQAEPSLAHALHADLVERSRGIPELRGARRAWLERGVTLLEGQEPQLALARCLEAARELPEAAALWDAAERLTREVGDPAALRAAYAATLTEQIAALTSRSSTSDGEEKSASLTDAARGSAASPELVEELGRRFVDTLEEWFDEPEQVVELLSQIVTAAPTATWALDRLKLAWSAAARWDELFGVYDRLLALEEPGLDRAALLEEAALAARDFAGDRPRAIGYLEALAALRPADTRVESHLERLYEREELNQPLIELITARLPRLSAVEALSQRLRIASLWLASNEPRQALDELAACLGETDDPGARAEAYALLERLLELPLPPESLPPGTGARRRRALGVRDDAALLLKAHYEAQGRTEQVARMLEIELEAAPDTAALIERLGELIELRLSSLNDPAGAFEHAGELVALAPENAAYRQRLAALAAQAGLGLRHGELLVQVAARCDSPSADAAPNDTLAYELRHEAAQVFEREGEPTRAAELLGAVTHAEGAGLALRLAAAERLDALLSTGHGPSPSRDAERADVLEHLAALSLAAEEPAVRGRALSEAARLAQESLEDLPRAARLWRARLADVPDDRAALDGLVTTLRRAGASAELVQALDARAALDGSHRARREDQVEAAALVETALGDAPGAIARWEAVEATLGAGEDSFHALCRLLQSEGRYPELAARLEREAASEAAGKSVSASDDEARSQSVDGSDDETGSQSVSASDDEAARHGRARALYRRLAEVHLEHTGDVPAALAAFARAAEWELATQAVKAQRDPELGLNACVELHRLAVRDWQEQGDQRARGVARWAIQDLRERWLERGRHQAVVDLLLGAAALGFEAAERRAFSYEAAILLQERLGEAERAAELLTQVVDEAPGDELGLASVPRLALLFDELGDSQGKVRLWEQQAASHEQSGDRLGAARLWSRAAELAETELGDRDRALTAHRRGAALGGEASLSALVRLHAAAGELRDQIAALEWLCAGVSREALAGRVLELARAYEQLGDRPAARARLEQALGRAIDASAVRARLAELYRADRDYPRLAELLAEEARRATAAPRRRALFEEAASLYLTELSAPSQALPLLTQALEAEPTDVALRLHVAGELAGQGGDEGLVRAEELLREQLAWYGPRRPKERAWVHHRLAQVLTRAGKDGALTELEVAARIDPAHPELLAELGRVAFEAGHHARSEQAFRALLLVLKPGAEPASTDAPSRAEAFVYLSELAVLQDDPTRATEFVESAFEAALESEHEGHRLEQTLRVRRRHELLARVVEARLQQATSPAETARALADLVLLYAEGALGEAPSGRDRVRQRAEWVLEALDDSQQPSELAWSALGQVYEWLGDRAREAEVLERRVAAGGAADVEALYRLAELRLAEPASVSQGIDLLERALDVEADWGRADRLLHAALADPDLPDRTQVARLLEAISRVPEREASLLVALTELASTEGAQPVREGYELALRRDERELARQILERGIQATLDADDAAWVRLTLGQLLEQDGELERALGLQQEAFPLLEPEAGRALLLRLAEAAIEAEQPQRAAELLNQLRAESPADPAVWRPLTRLLSAPDHAEERLAVIMAALELATEIDERAELEALRGETLMAQGNLAEAAEALQHAFEVAPQRVESLERLLEVLEQQGRSAEQAEVLRAALDAAKDAEDLARIEAIAARLGALLEQQGQADAALSVYQSALDWVPENLAALRGVVRALEHAEDRFALVEALERLLAVDTSAEAVLPARRLLALHEAQGDPQAVEAALATLHRLTPADRAVTERLALLYEARGAHSEAAQVLAQGFAEDPQQSELLGRLVAAHLEAGELERALEALSAGLAMRSADPELLARRAALLETLGRPLDALDDHERLYAKQPEYGAELAAALERALAQPLGAARRGVQKRLVTVLVALERHEAALELLARVLDEDPSDVDALKRSAQLARQLGRFDAAAQRLERLFQLAAPEHQPALALDVRAAWAEAGHPAAARELLEQVSRAHPGDASLRAALLELYAAIGAGAELGALLLEEARAATDGQERALLLRRAGTSLLEHAPADAIAALREATVLAPDDLEAVAELASALGQIGESEAARALLSETLANQRGRRAKGTAELYWALSRLELSTGALSEALEALSKAFEIDPKSPALAMELGELALDLDDEALASRAFRAVTMMRIGGEVEGAGLRAQAYFQLGRLAHQQGDPRRARMLLAKCLAEAPEHPGASQLMSQLG